MTNVPRRRSDVRARSVQGEVVVLDRRADLVHQLNRTAGFIWERCDGRTTPQDIADQLVEAFAVDAGTAAASVTAALQQLEQLGLLEGTDQ
jgi:Coenzyme PQQ synthesis protein D (PqqD)